MRRAVLVPTALLVAGLALTGCQGDGGSETATGAATATGRLPETISQPPVDDSRLGPPSRRVDLVSPTFSDPTKITNPLFPVAESVLQLGRVEGEEFRSEVTRLPETRVIEWQGRRVETVVAQYAAFLGGQIEEVAYDFYAQDDAGAVWYFGEDVFNFKDGFIADTHGTWLAGRDGRAAMIMPAEPKVGAVYRPENIPGLVFEEDTIKAVNQTLDGPLGPVEGGLVTEEFHILENATEAKTFGPGYGEFRTAAEGEVEAIALAVPTDALGGPTPRELVALERGAADVYEAVRSGKWDGARAGAQRVAAAWRTARQGEVPSNLEPLLGGAVAAMGEAVRSRTALDARQAAVDVARLSLDLQLRHRPVVEIDLARFDVWLAQLLVDIAGGAAAAVNGDFFALDYVRDRIQHALQPAELVRLNTVLEALNEALVEEDLSAATEVARELRATVAGFGRVA
jgi:hypothetical protein